MGLDMCLYRRSYVFNRRQPSTEKEMILGIEVIPSNVKYIIEEVAYWRKANAIHGWFVDNVQDSKDDCHEYDVSREQVETLVQICKTLKEYPDTAKDYLPPLAGFFFGSVEIDDGYWRDIDDTIEQLEQVLSQYSDDNFFYTSSW